MGGEGSAEAEISVDFIGSIGFTESTALVLSTTTLFEASLVLFLALLMGGILGHYIDRTKSEIQFAQKEPLGQGYNSKRLRRANLLKLSNRINLFDNILFVYRILSLVTIIAILFKALLWAQFPKFVTYYPLACPALCN
jgi:Na+/glutamate symporter